VKGLAEKKIEFLDETKSSQARKEEVLDRIFRKQVGENRNILTPMALIC
jgi:hypothetical protein